MELSQSTSKVIATATFAPFGQGTGLRIIGLSLWLKIGFHPTNGRRIQSLRVKPIHIANRPSNPARLVGPASRSLDRSACGYRVSVGLVSDPWRIRLPWKQR